MEKVSLAMKKYTQCGWESEKTTWDEARATFTEPLGLC